MMQKPLSDMKKAVEDVNRQFEGGIDTAIAIYESIKMRNETKLQRIYECIYKNNPLYIKSTMTINKKTGLIERMISELKEPIESKTDKKKHHASLEIKYNEFVSGATFDKDTFNPSAYISTGRQGEILPAPQFSKYQFILSK
jgi:Holliday junction resolvasome RuvABC DNA-binding subunit